MEYTTKVFEDRVEHYLGGKLNDITLNGKVVPADGIEFTPSKPDQLKIKLIKMMDELDLIIKSLN